MINPTEYEPIKPDSPRKPRPCTHCYGDGGQQYCTEDEYAVVEAACVWCGGSGWERG